MSTMFIRILGLLLLVLSMSSCRAITEPYQFTRRLAQANDEAASAQREFRETGQFEGVYLGTVDRGSQRFHRMRFRGPLVDETRVVEILLRTERGDLRADTIWVRDVVAHILEVEGDLGTGPPVTLVLHERWPAIEHPPRPWSELGGRSRTDYPDRIPEDEWRGVPRQIHLHADYAQQRMVYEEEADGSRIWIFYQIEADLFGHALVRDCDVGWHRRSSLRSVTGKAGLVGTAVVDTVMYPLSAAYGIFVYVGMSFW